MYLGHKSHAMDNVPRDNYTAAVIAADSKTNISYALSTRRKRGENVTDRSRMKYRGEAKGRNSDNDGGGLTNT